MKCVNFKVNETSSIRFTVPKKSLKISEEIDENYSCFETNEAEEYVLFEI